MKIYLDGKYKALSNTVTFRRNKSGGILAYNALTDKAVEINKRELKYLSKLNGRVDPYNVPGFDFDEAQNYYEKFDDMGMLRRPGRFRTSGLSVYCTLFMPNKLKKSKSVFFKVYNFFLYTLCVPIFLFGLNSYIKSDLYLESEHIILGFIVGLLIGMLTHEISHANANLSYGGRFLELGVMISGIFPGAYVILDNSRIKSPLKQAQVNLAGIETNLVLSGLFFMASSSYTFYMSSLREYMFAFSVAAFQNAFLAALNICFYDGLDGEHALGNILGRQFIATQAKIDIRRILHAHKRKRFVKKYGKANVAACLLMDILILVSQLIYPLLIIGDIALVIGG